MLIKTLHISDSTFSGLQHVKPHHSSQHILHSYPSSKLAISNLNQNQASQGFISNFRRRLQWKYIVRSSADVEPSLPVPEPPQNNILSWIVAVAISIVIPLINYKWGPLLKNKIESAMKMTEDVVEAVEKVADEVEKVAEDIADDLPEGGKLRKAVDFVENLAERAAKNAGAVDDFIDEVQEEEEKAESFGESLEDEHQKPLTKSKLDDDDDDDDEKSNDQNLHK